MHCPRISLFAVVLLACGAGAQVPGNWTIQIQCRSSLDPNVVPYNLPFPSSLSSQYVSLDDDGGVAIRFVTSGGATEGIFFGRDGVGGVIRTVNDPVDPVWSTDLSLRDGRIAISELRFGGGGLVIDTGGDLVRSFPPGGPEGVSDFSSIHMLGGGEIAYRGNFGSEDKHVLDFFDGDDRVQVRYAATFDPGVSFLFSPSTNDGLQMASKVLLDSGQNRVVRWEPDLSETVIADGSTHSRFVNSVDLAQNGLVAFNGRRVGDGVDEIVVGDGTTMTRIAEPGDLGILSSEFTFWPPAVNSEGWVVFRAQDAVGEAVFVGDGENLIRLVGDGDLVETDLGPMHAGFDFGGQTGRQTVNAQVDINEAGQVACALFLENGTIGVFVATPDGGCAADLDGDGDADADDFFDYLDAFAGDELGICDIDGDGDCDADDFFGYLDVFAAGC